MLPGGCEIGHTSECLLRRSEPDWPAESQRDTTHRRKSHTQSNRVKIVANGHRVQMDGWICGWFDGRKTRSGWNCLRWPTSHVAATAPGWRGTQPRSEGWVKVSQAGSG